MSSSRSSSSLVAPLQAALSSVPGWAGVAAAVVGAGALGAYISSKMRAREPAPENVYVLIVRIKLRSGRSVDEFFGLWASYADWVRANEPNTLTYKAMVSAENERELIIYERYKTKADLTEIHQKSEEFARFGKALKASDLILEFQGSSYFEQSPGFHSRGEQAAPSS